MIMICGLADDESVLFINPASADLRVLVLSPPSGGGAGRIIPQQQADVDNQQNRKRNIKTKDADRVNCFWP